MDFHSVEAIGNMLREIVIVLVKKKKESCGDSGDGTVASGGTSSIFSVYLKINRDVRRIREIPNAVCCRVRGGIVGDGNGDTALARVSADTCSDTRQGLLDALLPVVGGNHHHGVEYMLR
jgi:hypothetical protein